MKTFLFVVIAALAAAQQNDFTPSVRLAGSGFFQGRGAFTSNSDGQFQNGFQSTSFQDSRGFESSPFQEASGFQRSSFQEGNDFQRTSFQDSRDNQRSSFQEGNDFQSGSGFRRTTSFQDGRDNQRTSLLSGSQTDFFQGGQNQRFSQGSRENAFGRSETSPRASDGTVGGVFEPLNLPSGASALLGSISSSFSCVDRPYGYYADPDNFCRVFYVCNPTLFADSSVHTYQYSFMCGEGTIFDQEQLTCVKESTATACQEAPNFYFKNQQFGSPEDKQF